MSRASSLQYDIIAGMLTRQPYRPLGKPDQVLVELGVEQRGVSTSAQEPVIFSGAALRRHPCIGVAEHRVGDRAHPLTVQADRRVEQQQRWPPDRAGRGQMHRESATDERPTISTGVGFVVEQRANAATLASRVHGAADDDLPWPSRSARRW